MAEASRNNTGVGSSAPVSAFESFVSEHFVRLLVGIAAGGGALAFFVPWLLYIAGITGEADTNLRLHILYVTGGIIAVLGLVETRHKNTTDRAKALSEQARQFNETIAKEREKIEADKAKNEQTHMRQVHAERRSRYIAAIESQPPTAALSAPTTSSSPYTSTTSSPPLTPSVQTVSPLPSNSLSSKTEDSPTPATRPEGSPPGRISVEFDDAPSSGEKIGRDKYQVSSSGYVRLRVGWSSISYNNTVSSNDCEIVLTPSGPAPVKGEKRTAKCTDTYGTSLEFSEPGEYTISVEDKQSGNTGSRVIQIVK